jgi:hypothetical protein
MPKQNIEKRAPEYLYAHCADRFLDARPADIYADGRLINIYKRRKCQYSLDTLGEKPYRDYTARQKSDDNIFRTADRSYIDKPEIEQPEDGGDEPQYKKTYARAEQKQCEMSSRSRNRRRYENTRKNYDRQKSLRHIYYDLAYILSQKHAEKIYGLYVIGGNAAVSYPVPELALDRAAEKTGQQDRHHRIHQHLIKVNVPDNVVIRVDRPPEKSVRDKNYKLDQYRRQRLEPVRHRDHDPHFYEI